MLTQTVASENHLKLGWRAKLQVKFACDYFDTKSCKWNSLATRLAHKVASEIHLQLVWRTKLQVKFTCNLFDAQSCKWISLVTCLVHKVASESHLQLVRRTKLQVNFTFNSLFQKSCKWSSRANCCVEPCADAFCVLIYLSATICTWISVARCLSNMLLMQFTCAWLVDNKFRAHFNCNGYAYHIARAYHLQPLTWTRSLKPWTLNPKPYLKTPD